MNILDPVTFTAHDLADRGKQWEGMKNTGYDAKYCLSRQRRYIAALTLIDGLYKLIDRDPGAGLKIATLLTEKTRNW